MIRKSFYSNPYIYIFSSYLIAVIVGALLLSLPISSYNGLSIVDAFYTATSAICVTGLTVIDIGKDLTVFGQSVVLFYVQLGGLGIIIASSMLLLVIRREFSFLNQFVVEESMTMDRQIKTKKIILYVVLTSLVIELIGASVLFLFFKNQFVLSEAIYRSVFLSISSFCNAGFFLDNTSLANYATSAGVNFVVMALIFIGGIGYFCIIEAIRNIKNKKLNFSSYKFSIHTKIAFFSSVILVLLGAILFFIAENKFLTENFSFSNAVMVSFFQSVTARTAGFSTIDFSSLNYLTLLIFVVLMFIGASPASAGGGIKTTTFVLLIKYCVSNIKNRDYVFLLNRTIPRAIVRKALSLFILASVWLFVVTMLLSYFESSSLDQEKFRLIDVFFESVSALGTVGLSTGITSELTYLSKIVIMFTMYFGKTGFLTLVSMFAFSAKRDRFLYPEGDLFVG
jgi:trk system potassium uptake protein